jgi:hypothetical protein
MKSFRDLFEEKKRVNAGPTKDAIEDARKKLVQQFSRPNRVTANPSGYTITNLPGGNIPDEQKFANLERLARQRQSKSAAAASDVSPEARTQAANTAARARETRPGQRRPLGDTTRGGPVKVTQLKPSQPAPAPKPEVVQQSVVSKKAAAYRKKVAQQGEKVLRSLQRGQETTSRMGRGYSKSLARTGDDIIAGIGAERKAETAAGKAEFKKLRYGRGKSGPATELRTPAQTKTYQTGVKKGYFDPKTGRVSETGLQKHVSMRAVGGENFGKMQGRDPRAELSKVSNITSRAAAGDKAARSEVRRSYKSITSKYKPETGARAGFGSPSFRTFQQQAATVDAPKLTPQKMSMPLPGTQQRPVSSPAAQATKEKLRQKLDLKLNAKPEKGGELALGTKPGQLVAPSKPTTPPKPPRDTTYTGIGGGKRVEVAGGPKIDTQTLTATQQTAGAPGPTSTSKPGKSKSYNKFKKQAGVTSTRKGSWSYTPSAEKAKKVADALPKTQSTPQISAKKFGMLRNVVKAKRALGGLGRIAGPAMTAFDAYGAYKAERERGQTKERATKAAIYKAGGGALGGWAGAKAGAATGAAIGSLAGPIGTAAGGVIGGLAGGIAGYVGGEKIGSAALGASQKDKDWMKWANRKNQAGVTADAAKFKSGNKAVITDKSGKERVGYKAYKDGKEVYKHANDPKSLQYTSSNPLERIGRTFFPGAYKDSDEAARRKKVQSVKATGSK